MPRAPTPLRPRRRRVRESGEPGGPKAPLMSCARPCGDVTRGGPGPGRECCRHTRASSARAVATAASPRARVERRHGAHPGRAGFETSCSPLAPCECGLGEGQGRPACGRRSHHWRRGALLSRGEAAPMACVLDQPAVSRGGRLMTERNLDGAPVARFAAHRAAETQA